MDCHSRVYVSELKKKKIWDLYNALTLIPKGVG